MKIIKFILKLIGGLVALSVVVGIIAFNWDAIEFQYNKLFWEPNATTAGGVSLGDSRSDVIFKKGLPDVDITAVGLIIYKMEYSDQNELEIKFTEDGIVEGIYNHRSLEIPFDTVEEMKELLKSQSIDALIQDPREGFHRNNPWYDGRSTMHDYSIIDAPIGGSVLLSEVIYDAVKRHHIWSNVNGEFAKLKISEVLTLF